MKNWLFGMAFIFALAASAPASRAQDYDRDEHKSVPKLDHVFVIVLENHNSFTSFGINGILDNPQAPNIQALAKKYNFASNYNAVWHPSLPNYIAMITGDWVGTDVLGTDHTYPVGSTVGISDDDSPSVATDCFGDVRIAPPASGTLARGRPVRVHRPPLDSSALASAGEPFSLEFLQVLARVFGGLIDVRRDTTARQRIAELERLIGRQQVDLDFFREALRSWDEKSRASGAPISSRSSKK